MTYSKLPGVYFSEEVLSTVVDSSTEYAPLFLVQTSTSIAQIDDKITYFESIDAFKTIAENKGLAKSIVAIEQILNEYQSQRFYVCNIHTDTSASITAVLNDSADKKDIQDIIYIEETKSGQSNSLNAKIKAIESSVVNNSQNGSFRTAIILPYGTVADAVANKGDNDLTSTVVISTLSSAFTGVKSGRIIGVVPDETSMGVVAGHIIATEYYRESGFDPIGIEGVLNYTFTYSEMLTLQNMGICFVREEIRNGVKVYRINLGVTISFADSGADGLIKARKTVDALLRRVEEDCENIIKSEDVETSRVFIQTECDSIVQEFIDNRYIAKEVTIDGTKYTSKLTVAAVDRFTIQITGTLIPTGTLIAINVNTTIR